MIYVTLAIAITYSNNLFLLSLNCNRITITILLTHMSWYHYMMWRKYARYALLSTYAFGFFTLGFHTLAYAQSNTTAPIAEVKEKPKVLAAQVTSVAVKPTTLPVVDPTPTIFVANLVEAKTIPSVTPTTAPAATPTKTPQPTTKPSENPTETPNTPPPAPQSLANPGGLDAEKLFSMSNEFRAARGLPPFQKDERTCSLAASRAPEVAGEVASGALHAGLASRGLPYWNTENIISMSSEEAAFTWWVNDPIHHDAIVGNFTYSCVACSGNNCAQEFTNYQAK